MMVSPLIMIAVLFVIMVCAGIAAMIMMQDQSGRKRSIELVKGGTPNHGDGSQKSQHQNERRSVISSKLKNAKHLNGEQKKKGTLRDGLLRAGLKISIKQYWIYTAILTIVVVMLLIALNKSPFVIICGGLTAFFGVPKFVLGRMAAGRQKKFLQDFPDALEAVVRLLKAGMPVSEAVSMSAREFTGPVSEEMARMYDQQKIGIPLHEAAYECCKRMPLTEMNMFATSLAIQSQTGSSLSEVLMNLSRMIRSRFRLKRKVKALSSEAIASAGIIAALPVLVAGGMYLTNKEYISILFTDPFGKVLLIGAIVWMGIGVLMMKIMINFKV